MTEYKCGSSLAGPQKETVEKKNIHVNYTQSK
jgi:hypothetical protein